jgi:hypothetical protein
MDGVRPADGGNVANGFGVSTHNDYGFVTSDQVTANGTALGSIETFKQSSAAIAATSASSPDTYATLSGGCPGLFHGDAGLVDDYDPGTQKDTLRVVQPDGSTAGAWTPPDALGNVLCAAQNQDTADTAILSGDGGTQPTLKVTAANIADNTFGQPVDLTPALDPAALSIAGGIGQDTNRNEAVVPVIDAFNPNAPGRIVTADLGTGQASSFPSVTDWFPSGVGVDSSTHQAIVTSNDTYGTYDLQGRTATASTGGGSGYQHPAADGNHHVFVLQEVAPPDFFGTAPNNNAMSSIVVVDEHGTVLQRIEKFNFYDIYLLDMGSYVQLDPATSTGYTLAPGGWQLYPFTYRTGG